MSALKSPIIPTVLRAALATTFIVMVIGIGRAQPANTGAVEGRVQRSGGTYLNNARIVVKGTSIETFTNANGEYRLTGLAAGAVELAAQFTGLAQQTVSVQVAPSQTTVLNFELSRKESAQNDGPIQLTEFTVAASRELNAADIAANEQRYAANIKNVVDVDALGDAGEGNLGEFLKFLPSVTLNYSSYDARTISVRGLPPSTTPVMIDGNPMSSAASSGVTRDVEINSMLMNNIARVEVSKTPTPDSPANSMGGTVNVISKGAFDYVRPKFTFNVDSVANSEYLSFKDYPAPQDEASGRRILPGASFSYIVPVNKKFGFTLNGFYNLRFGVAQVTLPEWRPGNVGTTLAPPERPFLGAHSLRDQPTIRERVSFGGTTDWKIGAHGMLTLATQYTEVDIYQTIETWTTSPTGTTNTRPTAYDETMVLGAPGAGSSILNTNYRRKVDTTWHSSVKYRHIGAVWTLDGGGFFSKATNRYRDVDMGNFSGVRADLRNITVRYDGINTVRQGPGTVTAMTASGAAADIYSLASYTLINATSSQPTSSDAISGVHANARRDLTRTFTLRGGINVRRQSRDTRTSTPTWTFVGPDGVANNADDRVSLYDVIDTQYSQANVPFDLPHIERPSGIKAWNLYKAHPEYFRLDKVADINTSTAGSRKLTETISATYLRGDLRLLNNRLLLVGGVRYERTADDGYGRLADIRATYRQDANGNLILDAAGRPIRISTDPVQIARLQYQDRGAHAYRKYGDFYPSFNATFTITENFLARAAFARTIGRPNFNEIIPGVTVTDPAGADGARTITVVNTGLQPWTSNNYDISLEYYFPKSGRFTMGGFAKEISNFFESTRTPATAETLAEFGLTDDYVGYDLVTKNNIGDAKVTGFEVDYQQPLTFLPRWAKGIQIFANYTGTHLTGRTTADFSGFTRQSANWGVSLNRDRCGVRINWNYRGRQRLGALTGAGSPPGGYVYNAPYLTMNVNAEYRITKHLGVYFVVRNIANKPLVEERYASVTPDYARVSNLQNLGAQITVGIKGEF